MIAYHFRVLIENRRSEKHQHRINWILLYIVVVVVSILSYFFFSFQLFFSQVSFFSTSPELSNKNRFEYFSRTIPSDHYQVMAMVDIVKRMKWSYISIIYEESNYGIKVCIHKQEVDVELYYFIPYLCKCVYSNPHICF